MTYQVYIKHSDHQRYMDGEEVTGTNEKKFLKGRGISVKVNVSCEEVKSIEEVEARGFYQGQKYVEYKFKRPSEAEDC